LAPPENVRPGQWAVAVGRTFRADRINVTVGIVSALGRMFGKAIQTDADVSMANYGGPLVDLRGRVLGLIVPMAPRGASEVAGAEWYDSGIGFAVPLAGLADRIERMKKGEDQRAGLLGVSMSPQNPQSSPAEFAAVRPDSPAAQAGLKKGDRIVELNGKPVHTQNDLRFALGAAYAGDSVRLVAVRGNERIERTVTLAGELPAFRHAFLGILPMRPLASPTMDDKKSDSAEKKSGGKTASHRNADKAVSKNSSQQKPARPAGTPAPRPPELGVVVRMVYDASPAAEAGIQAGDRIVGVYEAKTDSIDDAITALNSIAPGTKVNLRLLRGNRSIDKTLSAARLPTNVPGELPSAYDASSGDAADKAATAPAGETRELKLPEFSNNCQVYLPASHDAGRPHAILFWIQTPSEAKPDEIIRAWKAICDRDGMILVVPSPAEAGRWEPIEVEYLRRLAERLIAQYKIDHHRIVVCGQGNGGSIAWLLALSSRDIFQGVASSAAPLPRPLRVPQNEPAQRLAVYAAIPASKDSAAPVMLALRKMADAGYNVATATLSNAGGQLSDEERNQIARWIDTLDRF
jgi:serine protease Do